LNYVYHNLAIYCPWGARCRLIIGRFLLKKVYSSEEEKAREQAAIILKEAELKAESLKKDKIIEAKEQFLKLKTEYDEEANRKKNQIIANENRLRQREQSLSKQFEQTKRKEENG
jgi:ribonucrease Y